MVFNETEIFTFLKREVPQLRITLENIRSPTVDTIAELYRWLVLQITNCRESILQEIQPDMSHLIDCPDHYLMPAFIIQLTMCLDFLLIEVNCTEKFVVSDITNPTKQRTLIFLSYLIDFYCVCRENQPTIEEHLEQEINAAQEKEQLKQENDNLKEKIHSLRIKLEEKEIGLRRICDKKDKLSELCKKQREKTEKIQRQIGHEDNKINELEDLSKLKKSDRDNLLQKCKVLSSQVLTTPEKKSAQDNLTLIGQNRSKLENLNSYVGQLKSKLAILPKVERKFDQLFESYQSIITDLKKHEKLINEDKESLSMKISQTSINLNAKSRQIFEAREKMTSLEEKAATASQKLSLLVKQCDGQIGELKKKIQECEILRGQNEVMSIEFDEEYKNVRGELNRLIDEHHELVILCNTKRDQLFSALENLDKDVERYFCDDQDDIIFM